MIAKDPTLPHQICLTFDRDAQVVVTCNCWKFNAKATAFDHHFGPAPTIDVAWRLYLRPDNHKGTDFVPDLNMVAKYAHHD